jgi:hypothetical protein
LYEHAETLALILTGQFYVETNRRIKMPERVARPIKERTEGFFPIDSYHRVSRRPVGELSRDY